MKRFLLAIIMVLTLSITAMADQYPFFRTLVIPKQYGAIKDSGFISGQFGAYDFYVKTQKHYLLIYDIVEFNYNNDKSYLQALPKRKPYLIIKLKRGK